MLNVSAKLNIKASAAIPAIEPAGPPIVGYYFLVVFYGIGPIPALPNPIDIRFQSVTGLGVEFPYGDDKKSGTDAANLPNSPTYSPLVLSRGYIPESLYRKEIELLLLNDKLKFTPKQVQVILLNADDQPTASWLFMDAIPTKWEVTGIDANSDAFLVEQMTFSYSKFISLSL